MRTHGVLVRDRSADPGCDGCVRITLGTREQTEQGIAALEESLAAIGWSRMTKKRNATIDRKTAETEIHLQADH